MKRAFLLASLLLAACGPDCKRGHYVTVRLPAYSWVEFLETGQGPTMKIPIVHDEPARDVQRWVCDEYEAAP